MNPETTVLMSVYNGEKFLKEAIESILNQTYKNFEFIIINDGSNDSSRDIIQSFNDPRIRLIDNENNIGLTRSLNKGLKISKGKYIARMDADDISMADRLKKQTNFLNQQKNIGLVGSDSLRINEKGNVLHAVTVLSDKKELREKLLIGNNFTHGSVMFRKECIEKVGYYREEFKFSQDYDLWLRIIDFFDVENIPEFLYKLRLNRKSISVNSKIQQNKYRFLAQKLAKERRDFGKDSLQIYKEKKDNKMFNDLLNETETQTKMEICQGCNYWAEILLDNKNYYEALKWLLKSFINNPLCKHTWILILRLFLPSLFFKTIINISKFVKLSLFHLKQYFYLKSGSTKKQ